MRKAGVDHHLFLDVINELFGSPLYKNYGGIVADEKFDPAAFPLKLGLKDIRLVIETADELAAPMPLASLVRDHMLAGVAHGQADLDWSSLTRVVARNAGLET
jgi:3-hydroxyisobutyrate dehydrogenase-like beta-hydroxyacid dehydrogenase